MKYREFLEHLQKFTNQKITQAEIAEGLGVEFDFANKWAECIGQALYYGQMTKRQPACVLIMERGEKDLRYLKRLRKAAYKKGIRTFTIKPEHLINRTLRLQQTNNKCE